MNDVKRLECLERRYGEGGLLSVWEIDELIDLLLADREGLRTTIKVLRKAEELVLY